jgi:MFS family permease
MPHLNMLRKLQIIYLLVGMMFFYGIEQLFLDRYLGNRSARGYATIVFALSLLVFDVPTGIIADKIGRKVCLVASVVIQAFALVVLGVSNSLEVYLIGIALFGLQMGMFNGAAQALLYDWLADNDKTRLYAKHQGAMYARFLIGAGIANIASGLIAHTWGLRTAYFASIIPALLALAVITRLREPAFEKNSDSIWYAHAGEALRTLRRHPVIIRYTLFSIAASIVLYTIGEFGQVYLLNFNISTVTLGILWAIVAAFAAVGRTGAHFMQRRVGILIGAFCIGLTVFNFAQAYLIGIGIFCIIYGLNEALANVAESEVQHNTPSHMRATMLSLVNCAGNLFSVPVVLAFTTYNTHHGILAANRLIVIGVVVLLAVTIVWSRTREREAELAKI